MDQVNAERWEQGSEFYWQSFDPVDELALQPWDAGGTLWGSGRDAMRALLQWGGKYGGWRRLWCPSFFCQEVVGALQSCGLEVLAYADAPREAFAPRLDGRLQLGDAVLVVNFFGLREQPLYDTLSDDVMIIEDHSHDPWSHWSCSSEADWCVASLRKTLPVPDGGALWSPRGLDGPAQADLSTTRARAADQKVSAMMLKRMYLEGHPVEKAVFRKLSVAAEQHISSGKVSGISSLSRELLSRFPLDDWRAARLRNYRVFSTMLSSLSQVEVLPPANKHSTPFSAIVVFESRGERDRVRQQLIDNRVYPAILWSLDEVRLRGVPAEHLELAGRVFSIHCDMRYDVTDMERVARLVRQALG